MILIKNKKKDYVDDLVPKYMLSQALDALEEAAIVVAEVAHDYGKLATVEHANDFLEKWGFQKYANKKRPKQKNNSHKYFGTGEKWATEETSGGDSDVGSQEDEKENS